MVDLRVITAKITLVEKYLRKVRKKSAVPLDDFLQDEDCQDIVILNLMQAIQGCIDIAAHIVSYKGLGVPGSTADLFYKLKDAEIITLKTMNEMADAVGFRNLCAHEYAELNMKLVYEIANNNLHVFDDFISETINKL